MFEDRYYHTWELLELIGDAEIVDMEDRLEIFKIARNILEKNEKEKERKRARRFRS